MRKVAVAAMAMAFVGAHAQLIVANDQSGTGTIWHVDVTTGVASSLYSSSGSDAKAWGMAADEAGQTLYWNNGGTLYSASYASIRSGTPSINSVSLTYNSAATNYVGLAWNSATGKLLGTRNVTTEGVYEIDPVTGIGTLLFSYATTFDFGGLDSENGVLYGLSDGTAAVRGLYRIESGSQTQLTGYPGTETDIDGLAVGGGRAYFITDGPVSSQPSFYVYDIATGTQVGTLPTTFTGSGTFSAGAWAPGLNPVPEPATMMLLAGGSALLLRRRRKG